MKPDESENIGTFFEKGTERTLSFTTFSTIDFTYIGQKKKIADEILTEEKRLAAEKEESRKSMKRKSSRSLRAPEMAKKDFAMAPSQMKGRIGGLMKMADIDCFGGMAMESCEEVVQDCCSRDDEGLLPQSAFAGEGSAQGDQSEPREERTIGAFWLPSIITDENGIGKFTIEVPKRTSDYKILVRGITCECLSGEIEETALVRKELSVDVKVPPSLMEGDEIVPVLTIHNNGSFKGNVTITGSIGGEKKNQEPFQTTVNVPGPGLFTENLSPKKIPPCSQIFFRAKAWSGEAVFDNIIKTSTVRSWGTTVERGATGLISGTKSITLDLDKRVIPASVNLEIDLYPNSGKELCSILNKVSRFSFETATLATKAMATSSILDKLKQSNLPSEQKSQIIQDGRSLFGALKLCQNDDGSWPLIKGRNNRYLKGDKLTTSLSLLALSRGIDVSLVKRDSDYEKAVSWLKSEGNYEGFEGAWSLLALAQCGEVDFSILNRYYRSSSSLSEQGESSPWTCIHRNREKILWSESCNKYWEEQVFISP